MTVDKGGVGRRPGPARRDRPRPARRGPRRLRGPRRVHPGPGRPLRRARRVRPRHRGHGGGPRPVLAGPGRRGPDRRGPRRPGPGISRSWPAAAVGPPLAQPGGRWSGDMAAEGAGRSKSPRSTLQELQRRHELLAVFKCYARSTCSGSCPRSLLLAVGEVIVAELAGNRARARAVVRAWRWNLGRMSAIRPPAQDAAGQSPSRRQGDPAPPGAAAAPGSPPTCGGSSSTASTVRTPTSWPPPSEFRRRPTAARSSVAGPSGRCPAPVRGRPGQRSGRLTVWLGAAVVVAHRQPGGPRREPARGRAVRPLSRAGRRRCPSSSPVGTRRGWARPHRPHRPWPWPAWSGPCCSAPWG